jgi:signal transduction histidine kinase
MVSHELRTPLTAIKEGISIVLDGSAGVVNPKQADLLNISYRNVNRLHRLINDILDYQKLEVGKMAINLATGNLADLLREAVKAEEPAANEKGLAIKLETAENLPRVNFDPDRISQVIANYLNNAIKFTNNGGIKVTANLDPESGEIKVCVADTGIGIESEDMGKLFKQFQQISKLNEHKTGSTGLGLAICKKIIESHGGRVYAESIPGKGSKFYFTLPPKKEQ